MGTCDAGSAEGLERLKQMLARMGKRLDESWQRRDSLKGDERIKFEKELKIYRDMTNQLSYAEKRGREEGIKEGFSMAATKFVINMLTKNMDEREIAEIGGLSVEEVRKIRATMQ